MSAQPFFSIIIPALDEEHYLPNLLADLAAQTFREFTVHVVDGNSADQTVQKARAFQNKLSLKIHTTRKRNVSHQRNFGAKNAAGEWLIFMDADNRLPVYFLDGIKYQLAKHEATDVFTCWCKTVSESRSLEQAIEHALNFGVEFSVLINKPAALGALIGCRKAVFTKVQFDEAQAFLEDGLFVQEAARAQFAFRVFRDPRFTYSLRRIQKEGVLKNVGISAQLQIQYLMGKKFDKSVPYPMIGGSYYAEKDQPAAGSLQFLSRLQSYLQSATKKQREQARKLVQLIRALE